MKLPGVYVNCVEDMNISSKGDGSEKLYVVTPKRFWGVGLGAVAYMGMLRIDQIDTNCEVSLKLQWSVDGADWRDGQTLISLKTTADQYVGESTVALEQVPFRRLVATVRHNAAPASQVDAVVSVWLYARYR